MKRCAFVFMIACVAGSWTSYAPARDVPARDALKPAVASLEAFIEREMKAKDLPAVSIALVEGDRIVWSRGFGMARPRVPATADTVHRVASVSKLFTDLAVMQLVEEGKLDLDVPITRYLPDFAPKNPFDKPITLRQMMAHRSGLARESPVGHYFDPTSPLLAEMVKSLNETELVFAPGSRTKYSNAAIATVGMVVEKLRGEPFAASVKRTVLEPLGMTTAGFETSPEMKSLLADGQMWTYDGRTFRAPTFLLGTGPAGNLYASVTDLGRFLIAILNGGKVVKPETLKQMFAPQFADPGAREGFGLGFRVSRFLGRRRVGHSGAIYGFATEVSALPDDGLGVAVVVTKDCANTSASRIADLALRILMDAKSGAPTLVETTSPLPTGLARRLRGRYGTGDAAVDLVSQSDRLFVMPLAGSSKFELQAQAGTLIVDDPLGFGARIFPVGEGKITLNGNPLERQPDRKPEAPPARWLGLIGEYGWDHDTLYILEWNGRLYALIEWFYFDPLEEISPDVFRFPDRGLYVGEYLRFSRDATGKATKVVAANVNFERRKIDGDDGSTFRIQPVRPVAELRPEAMKASPPVEKGDFLKPRLVELTTLDPSIKLDIRYATDNNFASTPFYSSARAFLQQPAAEAVSRAHQRLKEQGYGLLIHDAYRPWYVTKMFWDATPASGRGFVANPAKGSKHNRGCAVDLTLYDLNTGKPVEMVGGYDEFSTRSSPDYPGGTSRQRWHRDLLRLAMESEGFTVNEVEWWHFDYKDWPSYPILNDAFEQLAAPPSR